MTDALPLAATKYVSLGFDPIPLRPGTKDPLCRGWGNRPSAEQWASAPPDSNVGIRGRGRAAVAVLDCDQKNRPDTLTHARSLLAGLGYLPGCYPLVQTASGLPGHIYVTFSGGLPGHFRHFDSGFGAGEFRYGNGAQWAAPPSRVGEREYLLLAGDFRRLPALALPDVLPILKNRNTTPEPDRLFHPGLPGRALALLSGDGVDTYPSRSEAEQAIITRLVNAGLDFDAVLRLFLSHPGAGKFAELHRGRPANAIRWLRLAFDRARQFAANDSPARRLALAAEAWANSRAWPGRTGSVDRAVFLAHAALAARAGRPAYGASARELAELSAVTFWTAAAATRRLLRVHLLTLDTPSTATLSHRYRLHLPENGQTHTLPHAFIVRECVSLSSHDVFRVRGLGKSAGEVWRELQAGPRTVKELAAVTGRGERTVKRALARMARLVDGVTGEVLQMVEREGQHWRALPGVDLDHVARLVGTAGAGRRQREKHIEERRAHRRILAVKSGCESEPVGEQAA